LLNGIFAMAHASGRWHNVLRLGFGLDWQLGASEYMEEYLGTCSNFVAGATGRMYAEVFHCVSGGYGRHCDGEIGTVKW